MHFQAERKEAPFELVRKVVEKERKEGNEAFNVGHRHGAITKYKRVRLLKVNCLEMHCTCLKTNVTTVHKKKNSFW